ncbi:hypothetical protein [Dactylosporangium sp. CS-033363]|uniref:hypothetical protein n=1 Tax=Dactylosporangium sp. CS-033363 TaxID=3239935 RepID=UPI003D912168
MGRRWWQHSSAALLLGAALALIGNLATSTVTVKAWWWPWLLWSGVLVLVAAAFAIEARRGLGGAADDTEVRRIVRDLAQRLLTAYEQQEWRHGVSQALPLEVRFSWADSHRPLGDINQIVDAFVGLPRGQLIILGEPGAGKSVLALLLSRRLLTEQTGGDPVPLFLPISSWDPTTDTVEDFVVRRLRLDHPRLFPTAALARMLVTPLRTGGGQPPVQLVIPVLDGLDELPPERIPAAITKLHRFVSAGRPLVLTCRTREYALLTRDRQGDLEQAALIEIQPVAAEHVIEFLSRPRATAERWSPVFDLLRNDPTGVLATTLTTPLLTAMTRTAYREPHHDPAELTRLKTKTEITNRLIDRYVAAAYDPDDPQLVAGEPLRPYPPEKATRWLGTLAYNSYRHGTRDLDWRSLPVTFLNSRPHLMRALLATAGVLPLALLGYALGSVGGGIAAAIVAATVAIGWTPLAADDVPALRFASIALLALVTGLATGFVVGAWWVGLLAGLAQGLTHAGLTHLHQPRAAGLRMLVWWVIGVAVFAAAAAWRAPGAVAAWSMSAAVVLGAAVLLSRFGRPWARDRAGFLTLAVRGRLPLRMARFAEDAYVRGVLRRSGSVWQFRHALINDRLATPTRRQALFQAAEAGDDGAQRELADSAEEVGDTEAVLTLLRRRVDRQDGGARVVLAGLLDQRGQTAAALQLLRSAGASAHSPAAEALIGLLVKHGGEAELRGLAERGNVRALDYMYAELAARGDGEGATALVLSALPNVPLHELWDLSTGPYGVAVREELARRPAEKLRARPAHPRRAFTKKGRQRAAAAAMRAREDLPGLTQAADSGDAFAATELAGLLRFRGETDVLTARATAGDRVARRVLLPLLVERGDELTLRRLTEPPDDDVTQALATVCEQGGRCDEAIALLRSLAHLRPWAALTLASLLANRGDVDEAIAVLRKPAQRNPHAARKLAELLVRRGDRRGAMALLRRWRYRDGPCAALLAELHAERDEIREALEVLERRVALESQNGPDYAASRALFGLLRRRVDSARLRTWAARDKRAVPFLVDLLVDLGDLDAAIAVLRPRVDSGVGDDSLSDRLAELLFRRGDVDELRRWAQLGEHMATVKYAQHLYESGRVDDGDTFLGTFAPGKDNLVSLRLARLLLEAGRDDLFAHLAERGFVGPRLAELRRAAHRDGGRPLSAAEPTESGRSSSGT